MKENAYLTLLDNEPYIYSVIACYSSWLKTNSKYKFYCACTATVPEHILKVLKELNINIINLPEVSGLEKLKVKLKESGFDSWVPALSKLGIYKLDQFKKFIFLDADTYIYKNLDHLFELDSISGVPDGLGWTDKTDKFVPGDNYFKKFNAGMLVVEPSLELYNSIIKLTQKLPIDRPWADQNIVSELFPNWPNEAEKHLPVYYNCFGREIYHYKENIPDFSVDKIAVLHMVGRKLSPDYDFSNVFYTLDSTKHIEYYKLIYNICREVNAFIEAKKSLGLLKCIRKVKLPKANFDAYPDQKIDLVVAYVDSSDKAWQTNFNCYNKHTFEEEAINAPNRFRGQGDFFRFFFRGIENNMPWVNNIYILVQNKTEVPAWLDTEKVTVVTHKEFIPQEFLPTFNSCTIEMFLWNIPGLSEHFIYANDDFFITCPIFKDDFFEGNKIKYNLKYYTYNDTRMYECHCWNSYHLVSKDADKTLYLSPEHSLRPYSKSEMLACYKTYKKEILNSISRFRETKNFNCYLYIDDLAAKQKTVPSLATFKYFGTRHVANKYSTYIKSILTSANVICINDDDAKHNIYNNPALNLSFYELFPIKSKYELTDYKPDLEYLYRLNHIETEKQVLAYGKPNTYLYF